MIEIQYKISKELYLEAYTAYDDRTKLRKADKIVSILLLLAGIAFGILNYFGDFKLSYAIFSAALFLLGIAEWFHWTDLGKLIMVIRYKTDDKFKNHQTLKLSNALIEYSTEKITSTIEWSFYQKYLECKNAFLLIYGKRQYSIIPKAAMTEDQLTEFRKMLQLKMGSESVMLN